MTEAKVKPESTRAVVLIEAIDKLGAAEELVRVHPSRAGSLVESGKARWAIKADFGIA